jgi:L-alanine-DL-glutamate epimerase and related enzymes of enolase superfamily
VKIRDIELTFVEVPVIPLAKGGISPYAGSRDKTGTTTATSAIYKVMTDEGITGWGEMNPVITPGLTRVLLEEYIKPKLIGINPFDVNRLMREFAPVYNPQVNTKSFLTGIEIACWDIMGKALNKPVYALLGGKVRDRVDIAYAVGILGEDETREKILRIKSEGYRTVKTKGGKDVAFDIRRARIMREAGGSDLAIRVDMNQGYDVPTALQYLRGVADLDLAYVEQPLPVNRFDDMAMLRQRSATPIAINEDCYVSGNMMYMIKRGAIDAAVVDMEPIGGISEMVRIAKMAEETGLPLAHHCAWDMGVKLAAILHATSALPAFTLPMDSTYFAHGDDVLTERIRVRDGAYFVPEGPGLGVEVDEEKLKALSIGCSSRFFV